MVMTNGTQTLNGEKALLTFPSQAKASQGAPSPTESGICPKRLVTCLFIYTSHPCVGVQKWEGWGAGQETVLPRDS